MNVLHRPQLKDLLASRGLLTHAAEVGVAEGRFSLELLEWGFERVYLVDAWATASRIPGDISSPMAWHEENLRQVREKVAPFGDRAVLLRGFSESMALRVPDESLGFVYLDACHAHAWVLRDLEAWLPKLVRGGVMAGHDYLMPQYGIKRAVDEVAGVLGHTVNVIPAGCDEDAGFWFFNGDPA